jgi:enoyl-CoA hydratase/carnithine racemase
MLNYQTILYQKQRSGVLITLNRPKELNALNEQLMSELDQALAEAENDSEIRGVILTGANDAFSVGEDISEDNEPPTAWPYGVPSVQSIQRRQSQRYTAAPTQSLALFETDRRRRERLVPRCRRIPRPHLSHYDRGG